MRNSHTHSFGCDKTRRTIIGRFSNSRVWLFAWMAIATTLLGRTLLSPGPAPLELASASMPVELRSAGHRADGRTATVHSFRPIESLRVGDRVVADNPDTATPEQTAVDPATWRLVKLYAEETWPDGTLDTIHIETLQPPEWLELFGVEQGAEVPPPIDLVEMGLPEDLDTTVVGIEPCPRIQPGPGRVVLTTVNHLNNDVWELTAVNASGRYEQLRPTGFHRFYSETRGDWVPTKEIHDNEVIRGRAGPLTVVAKRQLPGIERVYNLTVDGEHVYYVSELVLLAHNTCEGERLFRGVPANGTQRARSAALGVAVPRGTAIDATSLRKHVLNLPVDAGVVSFTTDRNVAKRFAGPNGIIIEVPLSKVSDRIVARPNVGKYDDESEVLIRGVVQGTPTRP